LLTVFIEKDFSKIQSQKAEREKKIAPKLRCQRCQELGHRSDTCPAKGKKEERKS
jgi:cytochrome c-type biogenesis protein CcmH/NrfF